MESENKQIALLLAITAIFLLVNYKNDPQRRAGGGSLTTPYQTGKPGDDDGFVLRGGVTYEAWY